MQDRRVGRGQHFLKKLVFEVAQRIVPSPRMMNLVHSGLGRKVHLSAMAVLLSSGGLLLGVQKTLLGVCLGPDLGLTVSGCH